MHRRLLYTPLILLITTLACSRFSVQTPTPTNPQETEWVDSKTTTPTLIFSEGKETPASPDINIDSGTPQANTTQTIEKFEMGGSEPEATSPPVYKLQSGTPLLMKNIFHPELGCNWMGVGGQVFGESSQPVAMLIVELGGMINGEVITGLTLTGSAHQWGPGGYEFAISDVPTLSNAELWLQVLNQEGQPLSERVYFDTYNDCDLSAVMVNFVHRDAVVVEILYFPVIIQNQQNP